MITKGESMIPVTKIDLKDKDGTLLNTEKKYCRQNILVLPKLNPLEVTENGTYPVPQGFAGHGQVSVNVVPKKETALVITANGTYKAPPGTVYTSVVVNVPTEGSGDSPHVHKYTSEVTEPSCTMGGYTTHTCSMCHDSYRDSETDPNGHNFAGGWVIDKAPTCDAEGAMHRTCLTCGHTETASDGVSVVDISGVTNGGEIAYVRIGNYIHVDESVITSGSEMIITKNEEIPL